MKKQVTKVLAGVLSLVIVLTCVITPASALSYSGSSSYMSGKYYTALTKVTLTGNQRTDIVNVAKSQIGYKEGNNSSQLSGTVSGSKNYTEYGRWYGAQDMWCAMFVSWCAARAGVSTSVVPKHSFTVTGLNTFIDWGRAYTRAQVANGKYTPQPGDIIYFKGSRNNNKTNHVGIVTSYSSKTVYTIEGNTSKGVAAKSYKISDTYIVYICSPKYSGTSSGSSSGSTGSSGSVSSSGTYFPKCASSHTSIVDALKSIGAKSDIDYRKKIAAANGISGYTGTPAQNTEMLKLLKNGKLIKP